jgi:hypothetical protein
MQPIRPLNPIERRAVARLTALGFNMTADGSTHPLWGRKSADMFNSGTLHVLSVPFRDVLITRSPNGWYVSSHIKFNARRKHARLTNTFVNQVKSVFGFGKTMEQALNDFEIMFQEHVIDPEYRLCA